MARQALVPAMKQRLGLLALLAVFLALHDQRAFGFGGGATNGAVFVATGAVDTGLRERVPLVRTGGVWSGWPHHPSVALITIYAPDSSADHIILRELVSSDGRRSLLVTAPAALATGVRRASLYLRPHVPAAVLLEYEGGQWRPRHPQLIPTATSSRHGDTPEHLLAFTVTTLGFYWLFDARHETADLQGRQMDPAARTLLGGDPVYGALPWVVALLLLLGAWVASSVVHRMDRSAAL